MKIMTDFLAENVKDREQKEQLSNYNDQILSLIENDYQEKLEKKLLEREVENKSKEVLQCKIDNLETELLTQKEDVQKKHAAIVTMSRTHQEDCQKLTDLGKIRVTLENDLA